MKKYLVATYYDAEDGYHYGDYDIIEAENQKEAEEKYKEKHKCSYFFYPDCIGEFDEETKNVVVPVTFFIPKYT